VAIGVASIVQESNTFSPVKTRYRDLDLVFGSDVLARHRQALTEMGGFLDVLSAARKRVVPLCAGWAVSSGSMLEVDFVRLHREFHKSLRAAGNLEGLLLALHGAQAATKTFDVAGALLECARHQVGPKVPIAVTLDLHANITRRMIEAATLIVGYKTYPHIDLFQTGQRAARLLLCALADKHSSAIVCRKLPLIVPAENMQTTSGPFGRLMDEANRLERCGAMQACSVFGVQPWLDVPEMGCSVVAVCERAKTDEAQEGVDCLAQLFWDSRSEFDVELTPVRRAIREAIRSEGPVVISEPSDSTGSGSPGDSTGVLKPLLEIAAHHSAAIFIVDPPVVKKAIAAGVGKTIRTKIGGSVDRVHSQPVEIGARVHLISDGRWTPQALGYSTGVETCMGATAVLEVGKLRILVAERSAMTVDPELFRSHGIAPERIQIVVVKSPNGFRSAYAGVATKMVLVDTPGISSPRLKTLPYRRVPRPIYPLDQRMEF
jgi:microcystin degradation protein MlrC